MPTSASTDHDAASGTTDVNRRPLAVRLAVNLLLVMASLVVALVLGEVAIRLAPRRWVPELGNNQIQEFDLREVCRLSENPRLRYELIPDNPKAEINADGYRGPRYPEEKPPGVRRLVGLGDSSFFGWNVPESDTCLRRLEGLLRSGRSTPVEVVNLAVPGYNSHQELELLRTRGLRFDPDLIVLGYDHNDSQPVIGQDRSASLLPDGYGRNPLGSELLRYVSRKLYLMRFADETRWEGNPVEGPLWDRHLEALAEIARLTREAGIPVVVVLYDAWITRDDNRPSEHYRRLHERLLPFFKQHGFYVVDCYDLFQDYMRRSQRQDTKSLWVSILYHDGHPNARAHRMIAEALYAKIEAEGLLP